MPCTVTVGGFWGDEGKGKILSYLAVKDQVKWGVRGGVGPNAGHTVIYKGRTLKLRMLPSAVVNPNTQLGIGAGVLVNPRLLLSEVEMTGCHGRLLLDRQCAIIEDRHVEADKASAHLSGKIGTTGTGTGPCNVERVQRTVKIAEEHSELKAYLGDVAGEVNEALDRGEKVLVEGTQGTFLSLYHGTYPYVTSKDVTASSICADVGIGPTRVDEVLVVFKAYVTRVGGGFLPGELPPSEAEKRGWSETATVTGRTRRVAPFNVELAKRSVKLNGATQIALTKMDALYPECRGAKKLDQVPLEGRRFLQKIEDLLGVPVTLVGTGPDLEDVIDLRKGRI
ncbi:adenylosuccinate synthetase [Candidatus Hecatella orcuttiae]|jgi:adenylosuccinate synthase|uniref:adenylosuccinate synthetase n=1 Tax=Candidatus Hecatella orcuttiae TaxID=1935119 RepID=UPI0028683032|nr:adenylosuccinate synthetase [Candidatus Hecatella orcuttiae]